MGLWALEEGGREAGVNGELTSQAADERVILALQWSPERIRERQRYVVIASRSSVQLHSDGARRMDGVRMYRIGLLVLASAWIAFESTSSNLR